MVIVSSGAVGMGLHRMGLPAGKRPMGEKQALAAVGQGRLIALWDQLFGLLGQSVAQVLLTRNDIADVSGMGWLRRRGRRVNRGSRRANDVVAESAQPSSC